MPRKPTPKKAKPAKPDFVFPPGGAAIAPVPGLRLKPRTGNVPRWWPNDKPGKAPFACNVPGVYWEARRGKWQVQHTDEQGKPKTLGYGDTLEGACVSRASVVDGSAMKGALVVVDGELCVSRCGQPSCRRFNLSVVHFAPDPCVYKQAFSEFVGALDVLSVTTSSSSWGFLEIARRSKCLHCRDVQHNTEKNGEHNETAKCAQVALRVKQHWVANGGCRSCGCTNILLLQGDHEGRAGKDDYHLSLAPSYWKVNGGAEAMEEHFLGASTTVQPECIFCHFLQPSHNVYRGVPLESLTPGTQAHRDRKNSLEKQAYVNTHKIGKNACEHPLCRDPRTGRPRVITSANVHAFQCAHIDDVDKSSGISNLVGDRTTLKTAKPKIDAELPKCKIYCANCHHLDDTIPRRKEGRELLDALLARGAPVCEECE